MEKIKNHRLFKTICLVLIFTFISLDISYAYPPEHNTASSTLAAPSMLQKPPMTEHTAEFQKSVFAQAGLLGSSCSIAKYLLEDKQPLGHLESVMRVELGNAIEGIDLSHVTFYKNNIVLIPYEKDGKKHIIQIALRNDVSENELRGYKYLISDKYVIKEMPEDYQEPIAVATVEEKEVPEVEITEPITEVTSLQVAEKQAEPVAKERFFTVKKILAALAIVGLVSSLVRAADEVTKSAFGSEDVLGSLIYKALEHPFISVVGLILTAIVLAVIMERITRPIRENKTWIKYKKERQIALAVIIFVPLLCISVPLLGFAKAFIIAIGFITVFLLNIKFKRESVMGRENDAKVVFDRVVLELTKRSAKGDVLSRKDTFSIVLSHVDKIPILGLSLALQELKPLINEKGLSRQKIDEAIDAKAKEYKLLAVEKGILRLALFVQDKEGARVIEDSSKYVKRRFFDHKLFSGLNIVMAVVFLNTLLVIFTQAESIVKAFILAGFLIFSMSALIWQSHRFSRKLELDKIKADILEASLSRLKSLYQKKEAARVLENLYPIVLPCLIKAQKGNPIQHSLLVVDFMIRIAFKEGASDIDLKRGIAAALMHDIGAEGKIRKADIEAEKDIEKREELRARAIKLRLDHMEAGADMAEKILIKFNKLYPEDSFSSEDIDAIKGVIAIHDYPSVQEYEKTNTGKWLLPKDNRLAMFLREADRLWMLSKEGLEVDLQRDEKKGKRDPEKRLRSNIKRHQEEYLLYKEALGDGVKGYGFNDETLYRTKTGFEIFRSLAYQACSKFGIDWETIEALGSYKKDGVTLYDAIAAIVALKLSRSENPTFALMFDTVQSNVPESMEFLHKALAELKPLSKRPTLSASEIEDAIRESKQKNDLGDEETKILWLALTGPGEGIGNSERRAPEKYGPADGTEIDLKALQSALDMCTLELRRETRAEITMALGGSAGLLSHVQGRLPAEKIKDFEVEINIKGVVNEELIYDRLPQILGKKLERTGMRLESRAIYGTLIKSKLVITAMGKDRVYGINFLIKHFDKSPSPNNIKAVYEKFLKDRFMVKNDMFWTRRLLPGGRPEIRILDAKQDARKWIIRYLTYEHHFGDEETFRHFAKRFIASNEQDYYKMVTKIRLSGRVEVLTAVMKDICYGKQKTQAADAELFELVEKAAINRRAQFIRALNMITEWRASRIADKAIREQYLLHKVDDTMITEDITRWPGIIAKVQKMPALLYDEEGVEEELPSSIRKDIKFLDDNRYRQFWADGGVASIIVLARKANRENQKLIIGLETEWIPAIRERGSYQQQAIMSLMREIDDLQTKLRKLGLDNVEILHKGSEDLAGAVSRIAEDTHTDMHNIVVIASQETINSESFTPFRAADVKNRPFLAGVNPAKLLERYEKCKEFGGESEYQLHIILADLIYTTVELATGKEPRQGSSYIIVSYDKASRIVIFMPDAVVIDFQRNKDAYAGEATALAAA